MYVVRFSTYRVVEYTDPQAFQAHVGLWMEIREAENSHILGQLPGLVARARQTGVLRERLFALQDGDHVVAAGILFHGGCFCHTWASRDMVESFIDGLVSRKCRIESIFGPAHLSLQFAKSFAERTGQRFEIGRAERVFQLAHIAADLPARSGQLEQATRADAAFLSGWVQGFGDEAQLEWPDDRYRSLLDELLNERVLYLWKDPQAVSMAAWTAPTIHGASINFVFTPPEFRGKGYGRAVVAALAARMLASGRAYCFILTDTNDDRSNKLYQSVGASTLCELLRCTIHPNISAPAIPAISQVLTRQ